MTGRTSKNEDVAPVVVRQMAAEAGVSESDTLLRGKAAAAAAGLESQATCVANLRKQLGDRAFSEGPGKDNWYPLSALIEFRDNRFAQMQKQLPATLEQQLDGLLPGGPVARIEHELELENVRLRGQVELLQSQAEATSALHEAETKQLRSEIEVLQAENTRVVNVASRFGESLAEFLIPVKPTDK